MSSKFFFTAAMLVVLIAQSVDAKIWTVANRPGANFTSLSAAHAAASSGDTILISGSNMPYAGITLTKKLYIFGPGYFLGENTGLQADTFAAQIGSCTFNAGSQGSQVMGVYFTSTVYINTNSLIFRRNRSESNGYYNFYIYGGKSNIEISQSYISNPSSGGYGAIYAAGLDTNVIIRNCYLAQTYNLGYFVIDMNNNVMVQSKIYNCVIRGSIQINSPEFFNNIMHSGSTFTSAGTTPSYNIFNLSSPPTGMPTGNNNMTASMTSVFVSSGTSDGKWQIQVPGPAENAGFGAGVDCGMFENGEGYNYILSGIPPIPSIYLFNTAVGGSTITIDVNVKSNN